MNMGTVIKIQAITESTCDYCRTTELNLRSDVKKKIITMIITH